MTFEKTAAGCLVAAALLLSGCAPSSAQPAPATASAGAPVSATPAPTADPTAAATPLSTSTPIALPTVAQLSAPSGTVVWVLVGDTRLFRSVDRADTWLERTIPAGTTNLRISFVSEREGWLMSGAPGGQCAIESIKIWHTTDGALTWDPTGTAGIAPSGCSNGITFVSQTTGFVAVADQERSTVFYRTTGGGDSWSAPRALPDPPGPVPTADVRYSSGPVHAFGSVLLVTLERQATAGGMSFVYRSADNGATWTYLATMPVAIRPAFVTATRWMILLAPGQSQETTDAGATWHSAASDYSQAAPYAPQVEFGDPQVGYATVRGGIQRTVDGGLHWTHVGTPGTL